MYIRWRYKLILLWLVLIGLDQWSKQMMDNAGRVFRNYQFVFSIPVPLPVMYAVYGIIIVIIIGYLGSNYKKFTVVESLAWTLIAAGAVSNIGERLVIGYVKDFIYLFSGVFNFADFFILLGIVLLFVVRGKLKHVPAVK